MRKYTSFSSLLADEKSSTNAWGSYSGRFGAHRGENRNKEGMVAMGITNKQGQPPPLKRWERRGVPTDEVYTRQQVRNGPSRL
jgi:hypothetical protein